MARKQFRGKRTFFAGPTRDVEDVVGAGLCTGCGVCASIAAPVISMGINIEGNMRPLVRGELVASKNEQIMAVCPGVSVQGPGRPQGVTIHPVWGPMRELHRSWSSDPVVRHKGAAGGTLTALGRYLLTSGRVHAVLHVRADDRKPWLTTSTISRTPDEVLRGAQSRYGPSSPLVEVHRLLEEGKRFAVIAKPCDISAVCALGRVDPRIERLIPYKLTNFCGGVHSVHIAKAVMRHHDVDELNVALYRYRGEGWPGPLRVQTFDGTVYDLPYPGGWHMGKFRYELQFRCKICPDGVGEVADISAPDGWILQNGRPVYAEAPGVNVAVVRTPIGEELLHAAIDAGYLEVAPASVEEIDQMHTNHHAKAAASAALFALRLMGQRTIKASGYRANEGLKRAGLRSIFRQFVGTVRRVLTGENREHLI
ncbi:coenzyme F420 hydrogenase subunit beta [Bradyrhizobium sp. USDA 4532]|uniref:Coenzyme F420 hydrogenase/dehydrogenase, beta subunit C-terminal domain n=1 Tax=unclassified Bradyrhizobium TaxID=2631580 RepID=UPI0020A1E281|nr:MULTISPECIES: Coenzyme F420 hydrogenase/dehydrogenase, beta subunit C-terminal domain [unclassified Bradyrhizobium]MCP1835634.1 coenzyme F420 hydrogenase subunit beta [Bradyrhizobium sp. USDA 4545]MCP1920383.1 coenzyme F420 hydrogenase subunit beta [Bradyrhizobium sp. USDA 4532]